MQVLTRGPGTNSVDGSLTWKKDILLYDSSYSTHGLLDELVDAEELGEGYLDN